MGSQEQETKSKRPLTLSSFMTQSSIYDRHKRRRERTIANKRDSRPPLLRVLSQIPLINQFVLPYQPEESSQESAEPSSDTVFTLERQNTSPSSGSLLYVLAGSAVGGALAELAFGRPTQPMKRVSKLFPTFQDGGTLALQRRTVVRNQHRLAQVACAAGSASVLFGTKHLVADQLISDKESTTVSVFSSAAAGTVMGTIYTPVLNIQKRMAAYRVPSFFDAGMSLIRSQSLFNNASRVYTKEIAGAVVFFQTYETMKGGSDPTTTSIILSGASAGAAYRMVTFPYEVYQHLGASALRALASTVARALPAHAILFLGYESIMKLNNV